MKIVKILLSAFILIAGTNSFAADQVVTNNGDSGAGSLRQAITDVGDGEQITFNLSTGNETITLSSELSISAKGVTIDGDNTAGSGVNVTVQVTTPGTSTYRVFNLAPGGGNTVSISNITIMGGDISLATSPDNRGGGIYLSSGTLNLSNSIVSGSKAVEGGGIHNNTGTMTIDKCQIQNNTVDHASATEYGGGVTTRNGTTTITNSTITGNTSSGHQGGIYCNTGTLVLTNCTICNNTCAGTGGGVGVIFAGTVTITNCTIVSNTSTAASTDGVSISGSSGNAPTLNIMNTLLANNSTGYDFTMDINSTTNDNGYNIVESSSGYTFSGTGDITGDQANLNLSATLADNNTLNLSQTLKTTSGSVAIDAGGTGTNGSVSVPAADQRGAGRNSTGDIGAYEYWDDGGSLPVELTSITASANGNGVRLTWQTQSEKYNYGFEIERRMASNIDGWQTVGFVSGAGTSNSPHEYCFIDQCPVAGRYIYRLKQIDLDASYKYYHSVEVEVGMAAKAFTLSQNYPNPFNPRTTIEFTLAQDSKVSLKVYDMRGREVMTLVNTELQAGIVHQASFDASELSTGVYFYQLQTGNNVQVKRLMLIK